MEIENGNIPRYGQGGGGDGIEGGGGEERGVGDGKKGGMSDNLWQ